MSELVFGCLYEFDVEHGRTKSQNKQVPRSRDSRKKPKNEAQVQDER